MSSLYNKKRRGRQKKTRWKFFKPAGGAFAVRQRAVEKSKRHSHMTHTPPSRRNLLSGPTTTNFEILIRPTLNPRQQTTTEVDKVANPDFTKWVVFTARARVSPPPPSPTLALPRHGSRPPRIRSLTRSASWLRRVPLPPRSVSSFVTATES